MTKYTVVWHDRAEGQLARMWSDLSDRAGITRAADAIDLELEYDPDRKGQAERDGLRSLFIPPLHILYEVRDPDRVVEVVVVRYVAPPAVDPGTNGHSLTDGQEA
jgi:plasmid stabilization system protein ParE